MKLFYLIILLNTFSIIISGQTLDSIRIKNDTIQFSSTNSFMIHGKNYETLNNSYITGNSFITIRSQDNRKILVDGIPMNPILFNNKHYTEFLGSMHLLSYDLQQADINTLTSNERIISGNSNNAINFMTHDIKFGNKSPQIEINNFTTFAYQDFDSAGYSTVLNFNMQQSFEKFGYRFSLNNGFQEDFIPENGLQRYGGNVKLKYQPHKKISFTGLLDYTNFRHFIRSDDSNLNSNRLLSYINTDIAFTKWLGLYGKYGINNVSDSLRRDLDFTGEYYHENYFIIRKYNYKSSYMDVGFIFNKAIVKHTFLKLKLGYNLYNIKYYREYEEDYQYESTSSFSGFQIEYKSEEKEKEKVLYALVKLKNNHLTFSYLFNRTYYGFSNYFFKEGENKSFNNQLLSLKLDMIKNNVKNINNLGFQFNYGKLRNYSIITQPIIINPLPGYQEPEWLTTFENDNLQLNLYSSLLKNRIDFDLSVYRKIYKSYYYLNQLNFLEDLGKVTKTGYELKTDFLIIRRKSFHLSAKFSFSGNAAKLITNEGLMFQKNDTLINNRIISLESNFAYKNFKLNFEFQDKNGFDINLYKNSITTAEPFSYYEMNQITDINNNGKPVLETIGNYNNYITNTDYFILKHVGFKYTLRRNAKNRKYVFGLHYNKLRRIYLYVNDIESYQDQFQKPSFYNTLSLSFKMIF